LPDIPIGTLIQGVGDDLISIEPFGKLKYKRPYKYMLVNRAGGGRWKRIKVNRKKVPQEYIKIQIHKSDIIKGEVVEVKSNSVRVKIIELNTRNTFVKYVADNNKLIVQLRLSVKNNNFKIT
jgi:hypothetical protein